MIRNMYTLLTAVRNEDGRCGSPSLLDSILYSRKNGLSEVLRARLAGVGAADNVCAYTFVSMALSRVIITGISRRIPYSIACWAWKLPIYQCAVLQIFQEFHSRALPSREALKQHLCIVVDAEVLDGF
jgi:hypothetical protein